MPYAGHIWYVDVFRGKTPGSCPQLVLAEIELSREDEEFGRPDWIEREVTQEEKYRNSSLGMD